MKYGLRWMRQESWLVEPRNSTWLAKFIRTFTSNPYWADGERTDDRLRIARNWVAVCIPLILSMTAQLEWELLLPAAPPAVIAGSLPSPPLAGPAHKLPAVVGPVVSSAYQPDKRRRVTDTVSYDYAVKAPPKRHPAPQSSLRATPMAGSTRPVVSQPLVSHISTPPTQSPPSDPPATTPPPAIVEPPVVSPQPTPTPDSASEVSPLADPSLSP